MHTCAQIITGLNKFSRLHFSLTKAYDKVDSHGVMAISCDLDGLLNSIYVSVPFMGAVCSLSAQCVKKFRGSGVNRDGDILRSCSLDCLQVALFKRSRCDKGRDLKPRPGLNAFHNL